MFINQTLINKKYFKSSSFLHLIFPFSLVSSILITPVILIRICLKWGVCEWKHEFKLSDIFNLRTIGNYKLCVYLHPRL